MFRFPVNVSPKGFIYSEPFHSNSANDGADFGPDTMLGATTPKDVGSPTSKTSGIQEAISYAQRNRLVRIRLERGTYLISSRIVIKPDPLYPLSINWNISVSSSDLDNAAIEIDYAYADALFNLSDHLTMERLPFICNLNDKRDLERAKAFAFKQGFEFSIPRRRLR